MNYNHSWFLITVVFDHTNNWCRKVQFLYIRGTFALSNIGHHHRLGSYIPSSFQTLVTIDLDPTSLSPVYNAHMNYKHSCFLITMVFGNMNYWWSAGYGARELLSEDRLGNHGVKDCLNIPSNLQQTLGSRWFLLIPTFFLIFRFNN